MVALGQAVPLGQPQQPQMLVTQEHLIRMSNFAVADREEGELRLVQLNFDCPTGQGAVTRFAVLFDRPGFERFLTQMQAWYSGVALPDALKT